MFDDDVAYFRRRASEEREWAAAASQQSVAEIHLALAAQYESLIEQSNQGAAFDGGLGTSPA